MAKVYYVAENAPDYSQVNFFKTEKEALKFGLSQIPNFEMGEEPMNDEENDGEEWFHGAELTFKKGILYTVDNGEVTVEAIDEDAAREKAQELEDNGVAIFFDGFTNGMYGYQGTAADGKGYKWDWDGYDINESNTSSTKYNMKHVKLFEQFVTESMDTQYWADYNTDTSGQGNKEFANKSKDFEDTFSLAVSEWNDEADGAENRIKGSQVSKIKKLAQEFFKKEGWISVNVAQAMIAQES